MIQLIKYLVVAFAFTGSLVGALKCFKCNSVLHPVKCRSNSTLTELDKEFIVDCTGSCRISTIESTKRQAHLRSCGDQDVSGCVEKMFEGVGPGKLCHCGIDFCNKDWSLSLADDVKEPKSLESHNKANKMALSYCTLIFTLTFILFL